MSAGQGGFAVKAASPESRPPPTDDAEDTQRSSGGIKIAMSIAFVVLGIGLATYLYIQNGFYPGMIIPFLLTIAGFALLVSVFIGNRNSMADTASDSDNPSEDNPNEDENDVDDDSNENPSRLRLYLGVFMLFISLGLFVSWLTIMERTNSFAISVASIILLIGVIFIIGNTERWRQYSQEWWDERPAYVLAGRPARGVRVFLWFVWARTTLYKLEFVPQPRAWGSYSDSIEFMEKYINKNRDSIKGLFIVFSKKGGVLKTTWLTWIMSKLKRASHTECFIYDADTGGGKVAGRYGIERENAIPTIDLTQQLQQGTISNAKLRSMAMPGSVTDDESGVIVSYCRSLDPDTSHGDDEGAREKHPRLKETTTALKNLLQSVQVVGVDNGPGMSSSMTDGSMTCDAPKVVLITADFDVEEHYRDLEEVVKAYGLNEDSGSPPLLLGFNKIPWIHFNTRTTHQLAKRLGVEPYQIVLMPPDKYMKKVGKVIFDRVNLKVKWSITRAAYLAAKSLVAQDVVRK